MTGCCVERHEHSGNIKGEEFIEELGEYKLGKKCPANKNGLQNANSSSNKI